MTERPASHPSLVALSDFVSGIATSREEVARHIAQCERCAGLVRDFHRVRAWADAVGVDVLEPRALDPRVLEPRRKRLARQWSAVIAAAAVIALFVSVRLDRRGANAPGDVPGNPFAVMVAERQRIDDAIAEVDAALSREPENAALHRHARRLRAQVAATEGLLARVGSRNTIVDAR